jgi:hypothetical protein
MLARHDVFKYLSLFTMVVIVIMRISLNCINKVDI